MKETKKACQSLSIKIPSLIKFRKLQIFYAENLDLARDNHCYPYI